jgi:hypothetical protein
MGLELGDAIIPSPWKLLSWRILIWLKTSDLLTLPRLFNCNFHLLQIHVGQRPGENSPISVFASFSGLTDKLHAPTPLVSQWDHVTISHQYNRTRSVMSVTSGPASKWWLYLYLYLSFLVNEEKYLEKSRVTKWKKSGCLIDYVEQNNPIPFWTTVWIRNMLWFSAKQSKCWDFLVV